MKIAFDAKRLFNNHTGLGNYSRTLVDNLALNFPQDDHVLLAPNTDKSEYLDQFRDYQLMDPKPRFSSFWRSFKLTNDVNNLLPDIYHGLSNELPLNASKMKAKKIVTIHDLFFEKFPQDFTRFDRLIYRAKTKSACRNADHVVAISEATKDDIVNVLDVNPSKISVVYQSCSRVFQQESKTTSLDTLNLPAEFALYVGTINKRKNLEGIINAMSLIPADQRIPLVVVGEGKAAYLSKLNKSITDNKLDAEIIFMGRQTNTALKNLYLKARFFCLPSFYEGFGIPVIESLFAGTPVITSNLSSLPEAVGSCGLLVDPSNVGELSAALHKMTESDDLLQNMQANMPFHLEKFRAGNTAKKLRLLYKSIL